MRLYKLKAFIVSENFENWRTTEWRTADTASEATAELKTHLEPSLAHGERVAGIEVLDIINLEGNEDA